jgi:ElaB/YqjD/DUF883 family membrane-anchored ribosome-binding protein
MPPHKPVEEASREIAADLAALREDIAKLTASVAELVQAEASATTNTVLGAVGDARRKLSESSAQAQDHVKSVGADLEAAIERNPLVAVLGAIVAGFLIGTLTRPGK